MQYDEVMMRYCTVPRHHGTEGRGGEVMENSKGCGRAVRVTGCVRVCVCVWFEGVVYFGLMSLRDSFVCYELEHHVNYNHGHIMRRSDATHQQINAFFASQRCMLHLLRAWGEDVGALTWRGLHVGQTERPQVLHTLLHLQLIAKPCYNEKKHKTSG